MQCLADIDWENWQARDPATLVFVFRGDEILLINKKRGLGAGKVNGPGGKVDPGETPEQSAVREVREELCIEVDDLEYCGEHRFQFTDGYSIHVWVYRTQTFEGEPTATEEADPLWVPIDRIPFEKMWEDDRYWLPKLIRGEKFQTRWIFNGDSMLDYHIEPDGRLASWAGGKTV